MTFGSTRITYYTNVDITTKTSALQSFLGHATKQHQKNAFFNLIITY